MGERPIIYIAVPGETEEDFVQAATKQFRGDVFIELDPPPARDLRIEARFRTTAICVRGDAIATPATRNGAKGVLVRMIKLDPDSVAVPVWDPAAPPTPSPMSAILAKGVPDGIAIPRTKTPPAKHVVQRAPTPLPLTGTAPIPIVMEVGSDTAPTKPPPDDPVDEFATGAITNTSSLSADIAKTLHDPPRTKTHAKLVRRTPVAGVPQVEPPKPKPIVKKVERVEDVPPEPSIDDEWAFEQPTGKGGPIPQEVKATAPAPAAPPTGMALIGARATITPAAGEPVAKPPAPPVLDDDAALDSAFEAFDAPDDLEIPVAPPAPPAPTPVVASIPTPTVAAPVKSPVRPTPPSLPAVKPLSSTGSAGVPAAAIPKPADPATRKSQPIPAIKPRAASEPNLAAPKPRAASEPNLAATPKPRAASEPNLAAPKPRAASEPKLGAPSPNDADTVVGPKSLASSDPKPRAASEPKLPATPTPRAASEPKLPATPTPRAASEPKLAATPTPRAASEPKPPALPPRRPQSEPRPVAVKETPTAPIPAGTLAGALTDSTRPTPEPAVLTAAGVIDSKPVVTTAIDSSPIAQTGVIDSKPVVTTAIDSTPIAQAPVAGFVATGGPANTAPTVRTPHDAIEAAARASARSELGPEPPTSVGMVAATRSSTDALTSLQRPKKWLVPAIAGVALGIVVVIIIAMRGGGEKSKPHTGSGSATAGARNAEVEKHLATAAARIQDGKLVGPDGDTALDYLLEAKKLAPTDKQVLQQLTLLANTFERLGDGASKAGDLGEAATHYQAALTAEPDRATAAKKLADVEDRARGNKK